MYFNSNLFSVLKNIFSTSYGVFRDLFLHGSSHNLFGSGAVAGKILLVTNACWIFDYSYVSRSSNTRNNPKTANSYKCWNLQLYKNPSTTSFEMILVLAIFPFLLFITLFHILRQQLKLYERFFQNVINIENIY